MNRMSLWMQMYPVVAVSGRTVHAVDHATQRQGRSKRRKTWATACGKQRAGLIGMRVVDPDGSLRGSITYRWPPYVEDMKAFGYQRCTDCMRLLPGKPSRPEGPLLTFGGPS